MCASRDMIARMSSLSSSVVGPGNWPVGVPAWRSARDPRRLVQRLHLEISVIVPFYNVEAYLADCLDSILGQTFGDFEVLHRRRRSPTARARSPSGTPTATPGCGS